MSDVVPSDPAWKAATDYVDSIKAHMKGEARILAQAIQVLIAAEREACAKIADSYDDQTGLHIAAAIRARGQTTPD